VQKKENVPESVCDRAEEDLVSEEVIDEERGCAENFLIGPKRIVIGQDRI
jgi:hypothetical protein